MEVIMKNQNNSYLTNQQVDELNRIFQLGKHSSRWYIRLKYKIKQIIKCK